MFPSLKYVSIPSIPSPAILPLCPTVHLVDKCERFIVEQVLPTWITRQGCPIWCNPENERPCPVNQIRTICHTVQSGVDNVTVYNLLSLFSNQGKSGAEQLKSRSSNNIKTNNSALVSSLLRGEMILHTEQWAMSQTRKWFPCVLFFSLWTEFFQFSPFNL